MIPGFNDPEEKKKKKNSENIVGKGENASKQKMDWTNW